MADRVMKAYAVHDNCEGYGTVVYSTSHVAARRVGANDLGITFEEVESCRRSPEFDQYAPGPVSPLVLLKHGWWFECLQCGRRVSNDMEDDVIDDGLDPADFLPRPAGNDAVYCSAGCECAHHMEERGREEAEEALREVFEAKFSGAEIIHIHCYDGPKLQAPEDPTRGGGRFVVTFKFPGGKYSAQWNFGDDRCWVSKCDQEVFTAWQDGLKGGSV